MHTAGSASPRESVVRVSVKTARRAVAAAVAAAGLIVGLLLFERYVFETELLAAAGNAREAAGLVAALRLDDERRTAAANMAAATGEVRWSDRYRAVLPEIGREIAKAEAMAPPAIARRFDAESRQANDRLVEMEQQSFVLERQGRSGEARALLDSGAYAEQKRILAEGAERFTATLDGSSRGDVETIRRRAEYAIGATLLLAGFGCLVGWRKLNRSLGATEVAYLAAEQRVHELALSDSLTGLPNRQHFRDELLRLLERTAARGGQAAVIMIDLDRFKPINDRLGHGAGDDALVGVARLLVAVLRPGEICARIGGDEFAVASAVGTDSSEPQQIAARIVNALSLPIIAGGAAHAVGATAGIALFPAHGTAVDELLHKADIALYQAKRDQRGGVRFFEEKIEAGIGDRATAGADLRRGLAAGEIFPVFQPIVRLATGRIEGFEVLARWQHPERGIVPPGEFIDAALTFGLIDDLFLAVLDEACRAAQGWNGYSLAVNLAPAQLGRPALVDAIAAVLAETGFPGTQLEIEITENAVIADVEQARRTVLALKRSGVRLALDDFGIGYSSLHHLHALPFDRIKIDGSFVRAIGADRNALTVVNGIIGLAHSIELPTTAECVETVECASLLRAAGCDSAQGWHFGEPVAAEEAARLIARRRSTARLSVVR